MFEAPNYTQIPNVIFDEYLPKLTELELKILLVICRKTFGWHKKRDRISLAQLADQSGCERARIPAIVDSLIEKGMVLKFQEGENGSTKTFYEINIKESYTSANSAPPPQCSKSTPPSAQKAPTKETTTKEKEDCSVPSGSQTPFEEIPKKITKRATDGKEHTLEVDEVYRYSLNARKDWSSEEISICLKILQKTDARINNFMSFIDGTIKNLRKKKAFNKVEEMKPKEPKWDQRIGRKPTQQDILERGTMGAVLRQAGLM